LQCPRGQEPASSPSQGEDDSGATTDAVLVSTPPASPTAPPSETSGGSRHRPRRVLAIVLAILTAVVVAVATTGVWLKATTTDTDRWIHVVGPLASDPRVQTALADYTAAQLDQAIDAQAVLKSRLPPRLQPLAAPIATAVDRFIAEAAQKLFSSEQFTRLWVAANRKAHADALAVLKGKTKTATVKNGKVSLDLIPVLETVLQRVDQQTNGALSRRVPAINENLTPDQARARLSAALHRPLPADFGVVVVLDSKQLSALQDAVQLFQRLVVLLVILAVVLIAVTVLVAPDRRRIVVTLGLASAIVLVAFRAITRAAESRIVDMVKVPENREAAKAVVDRVVHSYLAVTVVVVVIALLAAAIAYLAGPGRAAVAIRSTVMRADWIGAHAGQLALGVLVVGLAIALFATLTFGWLIVLAVVVGVIEIVLLRLRAAYRASTPSAPAAA
jgi:hypothetical protein